MNKIFSERFKSARRKSGLSLQELSDKLSNKVTKQALHRYDTGEVIPGDEMIELLSEALNVQPDYFFQESIFEFSDVKFRKLNLSVKEQNRIIEEVKDHLSRYLEIEKILGVTTEFRNPLLGFGEIRTQDDIERAANQVREEWSLGKDSIPNCIELLENFHVKVVEINVDDSFDGMQAKVNGNIPIIALNRGSRSSDRIRFTVLHELGHEILEFDDGVDENAQEIFCHQFAAALLLPKDAIENLLGTKRTQLLIQEMGEIKLQYGISIQAIVMRARDLKIVTDSFCKKFFWSFRQMGYKIVEPYQYTGTEKSHRFNQLIFRALGEEIISINKAAVLKNQTLIEFRETSLNIK